MSDIIIQCQSVTKSFTDIDRKLQVLSNLDLTIYSGDQVAIIGRSGSGKTTFLQILAGLDLPTSGNVLLFGENIHSFSDRQQACFRNKYLGFIYQFHHLLPEFSALENVAMPLLISNVAMDEAKYRAEQILNEVGLNNRMHHIPSKLSGGERQRIAIARALVTNPACVLADEPTGNLDQFNAEFVFEVLQRLNRETKTTLIIVTHDMELANKLDKTYAIKEGQLSVVN